MHKVFLYQVCSPYGCYQETGEFCYDEDALMNWESRTSLTKESFLKEEWIEHLPTNNWNIETSQKDNHLTPALAYSYALPFAYFGSIAYFKPIDVFIVFDNEIDATIFKLLTM